MAKAPKSLDDEAFGPVVLTPEQVAVLAGRSTVVMSIEPSGMGRAVERRAALDERLKKYR